MDHRNRDTDVLRLAFAVAVGALSVAVAVALAVLLWGGSPAGVSTRASGGVASAMPGPASLKPQRAGHGSSVPGMSERELRRFEIATLGPAHAREHAELRTAQRLSEATREDIGPSHPVASVAAAGASSEVGRWDPSATVTFPVVAIHAAMLPTGKVMIFSYPKDPQENSTRVYLWDPATDPDGTHMARRDPPLWRDPKDGTLKAANIWCAGHTFTADGELVVFGGNLEFPDATATPPTDYKGLNKVYTFNPWNETWREQPDMAHGRWYPTGIRLPDGRIPILSGWDESGLDVMNEDVEIFNPPASAGGTGSIDLIGHTGGPGAPPTGEYYPHMFAMRSGRTLIAGPDRPNTWFMNKPTSNSFTWSDAPKLDQRRLWGTAVPMPGGTNGSSKVMALGGTDESTVPATNTTAVLDEDDAGAGWQSAPSNVIGRGHANTVLLPDGSMVEVGGGVGSDATMQPVSPLHAANPEQRQIELWDPETGQWKLGPAQAESRAYHSTALLLPDGRVMSAGDDYNGGITSDTAEIYEPPYLHKPGTRPSITNVQQSIKFGGGFAVTTPGNDITKATLMAPSAVTHAVDMNQRYVALRLTRHNGCVDLVAPPSADVAPPGWYMLFLLNGGGVPSEAKWVQLQSSGATTSCPVAAPDTTPPTVPAPSVAGASIVSGTVTVTASPSDNVGVVGVRFKLDGNYLGAEDVASPFSVSWDTTTASNGQHELTAVARDAAGNATTSAPFALTVSNTARSDTLAPSVWMTLPAGGATLSGTTTVAGGASDNVGVVGVQFKLDGRSLGSEDVSAPYSLAWNTNSVADGSHQLSALARDAAGNTNTSAAVTVTVRNPRATPPPDLAPAISRLRLSAATFRKRTTIAFKLSEPAKVTLSLERKLYGRKRAGKCVTTARKGARCSLYRRVGAKFSVNATAGMNSLKLGRRGMPAGRYRLTLVAADAGGKRSPAARTRFRLVGAAAHESRAAVVVTAVRRLLLAF